MLELRVLEVRVMALLHPSASDVFKKLEREHDRLSSGEIHHSDLATFANTAWHLREAIEKDPGCSTAQKAAASTIASTTDIKACQQITNGEKHFTLNPRHPNPPVIKTIKTERGFGVGRYGVGGYGVGEESIEIEFSDGTKVGALKFIKDVRNAWASVFGRPAV